MPAGVRHLSSRDTRLADSPGRRTELKDDIWKYWETSLNILRYYAEEATVPVASSSHLPLFVTTVEKVRFCEYGYVPGQLPASLDRILTLTRGQEAGVTSGIQLIGCVQKLNIFSYTRHGVLLYIRKTFSF